MEQQPEPLTQSPGSDVTWQPIADKSRSQGGVEEIHKLPSVWDCEAHIEWLIEDMIPLNAVTLVSAESGTGKTWLAYAIAGAVAHGKDFLGRRTKQRRVVYLDGENPLEIVKRNLDKSGIERADNLHIWGGWNESSVAGPPRGPKEEVFLELARAEQPLLIWDSLVHFNEGDEQASTDVRKFMNHFRRLASAGATVIVLHHTGKAETSKQYRGSSDIKASVDMAYTLVGKPKDGGLHHLTMENFKSRYARGKNFGLQFEEGEGFEAVDVAQPEQKVDVEQVVLKIIAESPDLKRGDIWERAKPMGVGRKAVYACLDKLPHRKGHGNAKHYHPDDIPALREKLNEAA